MGIFMKSRNLYVQVLIIFLILTLVIPSGIGNLFSQEVLETTFNESDLDDLSGDPIWIYDSDLYIRHVEVADLNNDNIEDVIAAEYDNNYYDAISIVYAIDGVNGNTIWTYSLLDGARSMTVSDLNNDNVVDVIVGAGKGSTTPDGRIHAINGVNGNSLWTFSPGGTGDTNGDVAVGNFNGDAYLDVAVACWDDYVYAINGQTGTQLWRTYIGSIFINAVSTGDVNGDTIDDVSFAHSYLAGFTNYQGVLNGVDGTSIWMQTVDYKVENTLLADFNNDDVLEAVYGVQTDSDTVEIHVRNAGNGTLLWSYLLGTASLSADAFLYANDIDDDGDLDLVVGNEYVDFYIYAFDGTSNTPMWTSDLLNGYARDISFGDVVGDGNLNIIASTYDRVQVLEANGTLTWYYAVAGTIRSVATADFDNDGILDVAAGGGADNSGSPPNPAKSVWALKTTQSPLLWEYTFGEYGNALDLGDLTSDSHLDVVTVCSLDDKVTAIDGELGTLLWTWIGTENLYAVTTGDFDNNGQVDVATAGNDERVTALNGSNGNILWQFNTPTDQIYRKCLEAADLNADNNIDVIAGCDNSYIYAINGVSGTQLWSTSVGAAVNEIELAQMDGTGPLDIVAAVGAGASGEKVVVLNGNNGQILWQYSAPEAVEHIEVFDVNNDSIPDVAAAITPYTPMQVIMIDGNLHTQIWSTPIPIASNVHSMAHGDLNLDGIPDLVVPGRSDDKKVTVLNGQNGNTLWTYQTNGEINTVAVQDMDNDTVPDVIAGSDDQNVYVLDGFDGENIWSYSTADDVMHIKIGDISGNGRPNIACVTFGSDGVAYAFTSLAPAINLPPYTPSNPNPSVGAQYIDITSSLSWTGGDPNPQDTVTYDVYFGTSTSPPRIAQNITTPTYSPATLQLNTTYNWHIISWDNNGVSKIGPEWFFSTDWNNPPYTPNNPSPANNSIDISITSDLSWIGGDPNGHTVTYDIYFGDTTPPLKIQSNHSSSSYSLPTLDYNTAYYWRIISWDELGKSTNGPQWTFTTVENQPPYAPSNPNPAHDATDISIAPLLTWTGGDPEGHIVYYDVYLEAEDTTPDVLMSDAQTTTSYNPPSLNYTTVYYWQIIAEDEYGEITEGPIWKFTTRDIPVPELTGQGSLSWTNIPAGSTQNGNFLVRNSGESYSLLSWEIRAWPDWGNWTFTPSSGTDLTPEQGSITIEVQVVAPTSQNQEFEGEITIVNTENPDNIAIIPVSLSTPHFYSIPSQIPKIKSFQQLLQT
jgi:outer membrane protein assembly factor BamB